MIDGFIVFLIVSVGTSHLWSHSGFFASVRNLIVKIPYIRKPLLCPECAAFWVGLSLSFVYNPIITIHAPLYVSYLFCGISTYILCTYLYQKGLLT